MKIIQWIKNLDYQIDKSKVAQSLAQAFLLGFGAAASVLILPGLDNPAMLLKEFINPVWLYTFFNVSFGAALSGSVGMYIKSVFDKPTITITTTATETTEITQPPNNKTSL